MKKIDQIWAGLESDSTYDGQLLYRRYGSGVLPNLFVGIIKKEKLRCLVVRVSSSFQFDFDYTEQLRDVSVELKHDNKSTAHQLLVITLDNISLADIFSVVCEDLIDAVSLLSKEADIARELLNRFEKWILLFEIAGRDGLSEESQRGLFGELCFIRKWLTASSNSDGIIKAWQGPSKSVKDFQFADWAVEVKTTCGKNHQKIHVSNERQLDTTSIPRLYLFHISLNALQGYGETLNSLVDAIRRKLENNVKALTQFNSLLILSGYLDHQAPLYSNVGYSTRNEYFYLVRDLFPRIEEKELRDGVGDVKYSIIISNYSNYIVPEDELLKSLNSHGDV